MTQETDWSNGPTEDTSEGSAKEKATQVAQAAKDSSGEVAQSVATQTQAVATEAGHQARDLVQETRSQVRDQAGAQHEKAVAGLRALVDELHAMAQNSGQSGPATQAAQHLADRAQHAANWIEEREPGDLLEELRRLGRRRPGAFLGGAALAGVLAGRLTRGLTAASSEDSQPSQDRRSQATSEGGYGSRPSEQIAGSTSAQQVTYQPGIDADPIYGATASDLPSDLGERR